MRHRYAQIDSNGYVVSHSWLSGMVLKDNMIPINDNFDITNKRYDTTSGEWIDSGGVPDTR